MTKYTGGRTEVIVIGGGYAGVLAADRLTRRDDVAVTGIETAAELAEAGRTVTLVCGGRLGPYLHPNGRRFVAKRLAALGVTVLEGPGTEAASVTADAVRLADGRARKPGARVLKARDDARQQRVQAACASRLAHGVVATGAGGPGAARSPCPDPGRPRRRADRARRAATRPARPDRLSSLKIPAA